jgi:Flp pilus assembly protein TadG
MQQFSVFSFRFSVNDNRRSFKQCAGKRSGTVLVLLAVTLIPLIGFTALAIDVGMLTVAQTQLRDTADAAALAGARTLNGQTGSNYSAVTPNVQQVVSNSMVLGKSLSSSAVSVNIGAYNYNAADQQFEGSFSVNSGYNMVQATVTTNLQGSLGFAKLFNFSMPNYQAVSTAAHQPRDVVFVIDMSGSMRFSSLLGTPYYGERYCNNQDTVYPTWGQYSSSNATMVAGSASAPYGNCNVSSSSSDGRPAIVNDFYSNSSGSAAWTAQSSTYATTPGGDVPAKSNSGTSASYAQTVGQVLNISNPGNSTYNSTFETKGYKGLGMTTGFKGYTVGPGYYGKTFYYWPPDPTNDWRTAYFNFPTAKADNSRMWDSNGNWQAPGVTQGTSNYTIDYTAILNFINNVGPSVFPSQLESGRIVYYTTIPTSINTGTWPPTDLNQRLWKSYIDYVLGVMQVSSTQYIVINNGQNGYTGYGEDFQWGTVKITALSSLYGSPAPYMNYGDNPLRPALSFWFGPLTMIDFLGNYNLWYTGYGNDCSNFCWWPGTCHESPCYEVKLGIQAALDDAQNNHPNDYYSVVMFSTPLSSSTDTSASRFNRCCVALGQNFTYLNECLWYPPATLGTTNTVTPYDSNNLYVPRANGGTCYSMALMLAYNQFSSLSSLQTYNPTYPTGDAGGNGRIGAQKIIVFETDGDPNVGATASFTNGGAYQSYYHVRYNSSSPSTSEYPSNVNTYANSDPNLVSQILTYCNQLAATTSSGGYSTTNKPMLMDCIAFGPQITSGGTTTLNSMQQACNVNDNMPSWKIINGSATTVISDLQTAIQTILQSGVEVSLIQ